MEHGITIAGNIIVDQIKRVESYPERGNLSNISSLSFSVGGSVPNTLVDLRRFDAAIPLQGIGCIGDDGNGALAMRVLQEHDIDTSDVAVHPDLPTSFTDVFTEDDGTRTFLNSGGAGDCLGFDIIRDATIRGDIFHLAYALLLAGMDAPDSEYGTVMARSLAYVQAKGYKTSMDVVSRPHPRAREIILASARWCDYFIVNEVELSFATGRPVRNEKNEILPDAVLQGCADMIDHGVSEWVVIHAPEGAWAMDRSKEALSCPSLKLPEGFIKGSVGAGDAFCAGTLYGLYHEWDMSDTLLFGCGAAASSLSAVNSVDGVCSKEEIRELIARYRRG